MARRIVVAGWPLVADLIVRALVGEGFPGDVIALLPSPQEWPVSETTTLDLSILVFPLLWEPPRWLFAARALIAVVPTAADREKALKRGITAVLEPPMQVEGLLGVVRDLAGGPSSGAVARDGPTVREQDRQERIVRYLRLTRREREVLKLRVAGLKIDEIAGRLSVSRATAKNHVQHLREKLGVHSQHELRTLYGDFDSPSGDT